MAEATVYALVDPRDNQIHYIGQCRNLERRFYEHRTGPGVNYQFSRWRHELMRQGLMFRLRLLETTTVEMAEGREQYWVLWALRRGLPIKNKYRLALLRDLLTLEDTPPTP